MASRRSVVIDPSAPYASGIRAAMPGVRIAVGKWHLVALANQMVTEVQPGDLAGARSWYQRAADATPKPSTTSPTLTVARKMT